jgi:lysophospholipase L1-like esterase
MNVSLKGLTRYAALLAGGLSVASSAETPRDVSPRVGARGDSPLWVEPMKQVHARFTGVKGTFAHFGDSITVTMAFWAPLAGHPKNLNPSMTRAQQLVKDYMKPECWSQWKGPEFGNNGSMTIRWARDNVDRWLEKLNPEVVLILFGSNDVGQMDVTEYKTKMREVVTRCLTNGTIVVLCTPPPRRGFVEKSREFAEAAREIAQEQNAPLIDYFGEILKRRPEDWDGGLPQFKANPGDEYQVPTLIARDGVHPSNPRLYANDYTEEALRRSGYGLRNYLTLMAYAEVVEKILRPSTN